MQRGATGQHRGGKDVQQQRRQLAAARARRQQRRLQLGGQRAQQLGRALRRAVPPGAALGQAQQQLRRGCEALSALRQLQQRERRARVGRQLSSQQLVLQRLQRSRHRRGKGCHGRQLAQARCIAIGGSCCCSAAAAAAAVVQNARAEGGGVAQGGSQRCEARQQAVRRAVGAAVQVHSGDGAVDVPHRIQLKSWARVGHALEHAQHLQGAGVAGARRAREHHSLRVWTTKFGVG